jgi:hypothetical protein
MRHGRVPLALSAVGLLVAGCSFQQSLSTSGPPPIPAASGTLSPAQAMAAERAVTLFLSAMTSLRIVSARPARPDRATVILRLHGHFEMAGHSTPVGPRGPDHTQWLATTSINGRWYVDPHHSIAGNNLSLPLPCLGT